MDVGYVGYGWEMRGVASTSFSHSLLPLLPAPSFGVIYYLLGSKTDMEINQAMLS
jgi:hypothetical protein